MILLFIFELGFMPTMAGAEYDFIESICRTDTGYHAELGVGAEWRGLFIGGNVDVTMLAKKQKLQFWPISLLSEFHLGYRRGVFEVGYRHQCIHPVVPYGGTWMPEILKDQARSEAYVRLTLQKDFSK